MLLLGKLAPYRRGEKQSNRRKKIVNKDNCEWKENECGSSREKIRMWQGRIDYTCSYMCESKRRQMKQRRERGLPHDTIVMSNWYLIWSLHWLGVVSDGFMCMYWWCSRRVERCRMKSLDAKSSDLGCRVWRWCINSWVLYHSSVCLLLVPL